MMPDFYENIFAVTAILLIKVNHCMVGGAGAGEPDLHNSDRGVALMN